jgi:hypothetical protein
MAGGNLRFGANGVSDRTFWQVGAGDDLWQIE